jgi:hypothetical protein
MMQERLKGYQAHRADSHRDSLGLESCIVRPAVITNVVTRVEVARG